MVLSYPPEPWLLHGGAVAAVFLVPVQELPAPPPPGTRVVTLLGRAVVTAAFFRYRDPSPLQYGEVMATVLVRRGWRPRVVISQIWVDSPASRDGGRELWAIPKELAEFTGDPERVMKAEGLASVDVVGALPVPPPLPVGFRVVQERGARGVVTPVSGRLGISLARTRWRFTGELEWLAGHRVILGVVVRRFRLRFGRG